jgi:hypothetical protein
MGKWGILVGKYGVLRKYLRTASKVTMYGVERGQT